MANPWDEAPIVKPAPAPTGSNPWDTAPIVKKANDKTVPFDNTFGVGEAALNMATGMIAKPISDVMGLAATAKEMISPTPGADPMGFKRSVEDELTYAPRSNAGKAMAKYNPIALVGQGVGKVADAIGSAVGGDAAPDTLRGMAGNATREAAMQAPGLIGSRNLGKKLPDRVLTPEQQAVVSAQEKGYSVPVSLGRPNVLNNFIDSVIGKAKSEQGMSLKNQKLSDSDVKRSFGIADEAPLTAEALHEVRATAGDAYAAVKDAVPDLIATQRYLDAVKSENLIGNRFADAVKEFPDEFHSKAIDKLSKRLDRMHMTSGAAMDMVKVLREKARTNKAHDKSNEAKALGDAQINAANALEELMLEQLQTVNKPELYQQMLDARRTIAQSYVVENALSGRGSVSAAAIEKAAKSAAKNGIQFTGALKNIAETHKDFPKAMQNMNKVGISPSGSPFTAGTALHALVTGHPWLAAGIMGKGTSRSALASDMYQRNFASPSQAGPVNPSWVNYGLLPPVPPNYDPYKK